MSALRMAVDDGPEVSRDGLVYDLDELEYHAGPELSSTGMKTLLDSPARFVHEREHRVHKKAFDFGHIVHGLVLGTGLEVARIPDDVLASNGAASTKEAKAFIAQARAEGKVPMKAAEYDQAKAAAEAVLAHAQARPLFEHGDPEVSLFADLDGVRVRGRLDWLTAWPIVDLKSGRTADPRRLPGVMAQFHYPLQTATYRRLLATVLGEDEPRPFIHVFVETEAPHLVSVVQLDDDALAVGEAELDTALAIYRRCTESGQWPGYPDDGIHPISLPRWTSAATDPEEYL